MIGKLFHLAHLVDNLDATDRLYDEVFDCERYYRAYEPAARREASLLVVSDQCFEPIMPSSDPADSASPLGRFRSRFGNRFHSIAWYVDDIVAFTSRLLDHGVRLVGLTGKPVTDPARATAIWTHPGDTGALLEFCEAGFAADPRLADGWTTERWRHHPLGLLRTSHVTVLMASLDDGERVYGEMLGGRQLHTDTTNAAAPRSYWAVGADTVIEVVAPTDSSTPEGRDRADAGNAVHAITFATADMGRAVEFLADRAVPTSRPAGDDHLLHLDLDRAHGLNLFLTDRSIPGDTRGS